MSLWEAKPQGGLIAILAGQRGQRRTAVSHCRLFNMSLKWGSKSANETNPSPS